MSSGMKKYDAALHAVGALTTIALVALFYVGLFVPLTRAIDDARNQVETKRQFLASADSVRKSHESLRKQVDAEESRLQDAIEKIPQTPQESNFLAQLSQLSRTCGVSIRQFSRGELSDEQTHSGMEIKLAAQATYPAICRFLAGLAELQRLCHIRRLAISSPTSDQAEYPVEMTLRIFYASLRQAASTPDGGRDG